MNLYLLIILLAIVIFICRLSGFIVQPKHTPPYLETYLRFVPIAVFSALIVPSLLLESELLGIKFLALGIAGAIMWWIRRFDLSIVLGLATLWLFNFLR
jgi:branched-subunit amino acid transport protein